MKKQGKKKIAKMIKESEKNLVELKQRHERKINNLDKLKKAISSK